MKRAVKEIKRADAILMSDPHLRLDVPVCRSEAEFEPTQWMKLNFISDLQRIHNCPVLCGGDLFHHWKASPELLSKTMQWLPRNFHTIYGQHDLPQHSLLNKDKSGIFALETAGALTVLPGVHWGQDPEKASKVLDYMNDDEDYTVMQRRILVWHKMNYQGKMPWPGCTDPKAGKLLRKFPEYDLILTGDNHKPFTEEYENRILVNPGSLMRQSADQADFRPRVYLYYAETNTVEAVYIPIQSGSVSRDHLERSSERNARISAFVEKIEGEWLSGLDFETNLEEFFKANRVRSQTKEICYKAIDT